MATIVTRSGKGSPLTHGEVDANFTNLNTAKAELSGSTFTGNVTIGTGASTVTDPYLWLKTQPAGGSSPQSIMRLSWTEVTNININTGEGVGIDFAVSLNSDSGTQYSVASIASFKENGTDSDRKSALIFGTSSDGATAPEERLRITSSGEVRVLGDTFRIVTSQTPASSTATGSIGTIAWDTSYLYVCTATNTWKRAALSSW